MACLIEIYGGVENALLIRDNLDHLEIADLILETTLLRKDPKERDKEEIEESWKEFKDTQNKNEEIIVNGEKTTLANLLSF